MAGEGLHRVAAGRQQPGVSPRHVVGLLDALADVALWQYVPRLVGRSREQGEHPLVLESLAGLVHARPLPPRPREQLAGLVGQARGACPTQGHAGWSWPLPTMTGTLPANR